MSKEVNESLRKITKGAFIILIGTFVTAIFAFFTRIIIIRNLTPEEYGILSLIFAICSIAVALGSLGMNQGIPRFIAYHLAEKDKKKILGIIRAALEISIAGAVLFFLLVFFGADLIAKLFNSDALALPLKIYSISIPFLILLQAFVSVFRGLNRADVKVIFQDILLNGLILLGLGIAAFFGLSLLNIVYAHILAAIIPCSILAFYSYRRYSKFAEERPKSLMKKALILFSLPIIFRMFMGRIIAWFDVLMIGYYKGEALTGIYNAALPLAEYISIFLLSIAFLYLPLATQLFANKQFNELNRTYAVLTKWVFSATLPIFLILFLFPAVVLKFLFGSEYIAADTALMILSAGFILHTLPGPNGVTLLVLGKTHYLMWNSFAAAILNVILNLLLIPSYGMIGAAIATSAALVITNTLVSVQLYKIAKIHPFTKNYLKPVAVSIISICLVYFAATKLLTVTFWMLPILFAVFLLIYCAALLATKSFDKEDVMMLLLIERKSGLSFCSVKRILKRFI